MAITPIANATAADLWCPFSGPHRQADVVEAAGDQVKRSAAFNNPRTDRCIVKGCAVWHDAGSNTGYCGLIVS